MNENFKQTTLVILFFAMVSSVIGIFISMIIDDNSTLKRRNETCDTFIQAMNTDAGVDSGFDAGKSYVTAFSEYGEDREVVNRFIVCRADGGYTVIPELESK